MVEVRGVQIVVEQAADAACFVAMLNEEVIVAPLLVFRVDLVAERHTQIGRGAVPVHGILFEAVERRRIKSRRRTTTPALRPVFGDEETHVGVAGGHVRAERMDNQRDAHRTEAAPGQFRTVRGGRGRQGGTGDVREVDPRLFKHRAVGQYAAAAAAAFFTRPLVFDEHGTAVGTASCAQI